MPQHLDHHDAELLLKLYDLRREEKLRDARRWFFGKFNPGSLDEMRRQYPPDTQENAFYRMVASYWDMASSLLNHGLINEDLFFENNAELWGVWSKIEPLVAEFRNQAKNPHAYANLESAGKKYEAWMERRAPGALDVRRAFLKQLAAGSEKR